MLPIQGFSSATAHKPPNVSRNSYVYEHPCATVRDYETNHRCFSILWKGPRVKIAAFLLQASSDLALVSACAAAATCAGAASLAEGRARAGACRKAKVAQLQLVLLVREDVLGLDVQVHQTTVVEVADRVAQLARPTT